MLLLCLFQDTVEEVQVKVEPEVEVEIGSYPVLKNVSIRLTDCSLWLEGRDFLSLGELTLHHQTFQPPNPCCLKTKVTVPHQHCLMGPPVRRFFWHV